MLRRDFLAVFGAGALAGVAAPARALAEARHSVDTREPPRGFPRLFGHREVFVGDAIEKLPRTRVCTTPLEPEVVRGFARHLHGVIPASGAGGTHWRTLLGKTAHLDPVIRLRLVNDFANRMPYVEDLENFGQRDYWAETRVFFEIGGDCEDFAVAKYKLLQEIGFHRDRLRIVLVVDETRRRQHAVLAVALGGEAWLLDSARRDIVPHAAVKDYRPTVSLSGRRLYLHLPEKAHPAT